MKKLILVFVLITGCNSNPQAQTAKPSAPAKVEGAVKETELATIRLSPEAEKRIGIELETVERRNVPDYKTLSGEVTIPPGKTQTVSAPVAGRLAFVGNSAPDPGTNVRRGQGLFRLVPLERESRGRDLKADAQRDLATAQARLDAAQSRLRRAEQSLRDGAGSVRNVEEAKLEVEQAEAARKAAADQLDYLSRTPFDTGQGLLIEAPDDGIVLKAFAGVDQIVPAGTPLIEIANLNAVWIRVPVYVGELRRISGARTALIHGIDQTPGAAGRQARKVEGVPAANPAAATVDVFFELSNPDRTYKPGERVGVSFATRQTPSLVVPWSAVLHDINGGAWVYENTAPQTYSRRRVEVVLVRDGVAALSRGPAEGTKVVKTGAAELFGTEFGVGK